MQEASSCHIWICVDLVQKYLSEMLQYYHGPLRQQLGDMQIKNDEMRSQIRKLQKLRYGLLASVMIGLVLPVAGFLLAGVVTVMMFLV